MLRVTYKNAAHAWLPIIMDAKGEPPQCPHPQSKCGHPMVWWAWRWCYPDVMAFSATRSEPNRAFMWYCGTTPETVFSTSIKQVWVDWFSHGRMVPHPSCRIPDTGGLEATVHTGHKWWPSTLLSEFTLVFPFFGPLWYLYVRVWLLSQQQLLHDKQIDRSLHISCERSSDTKSNWHIHSSQTILTDGQTSPFWTQVLVESEVHH